MLHSLLVYFKTEVEYARAGGDPGERRNPVAGDYVARTRMETKTRQSVAGRRQGDVQECRQSKN